MLRFIGELEGADNFNRTFNRIEDKIDDYRWVWPSVADEFREITAGQFNAEGGLGVSGKWAALTEPYKRFKELKYPGMPILQATGHMMESLLDFEAGDHIFRPEKDSLTIGTKDPKAVYHQRGTPKMKARPIISMSQYSKTRIQKAIQKELVQYVRQQGFIVSGGTA